MTHPGPWLGRAARLYVLVAVLVYSAFVYLVASHAATDGLCCADDGAIALVAKSVANGDGYALPINFISESGNFPLHAGISTGPTLVFPAAAIIAVVGPQPWAPSVASAAISCGLLLLISILVGRAAGRRCGAIFLAVLVPMLYALTSGEFFVHWYALLGELPAVMLLILSAWLAVASGQGRASPGLSFLAGLLAGLAAQSKLLALIGGISIGGFFAWRLLRRGGTPALLDGIFYTAGLVLPLLAFELLRLGVLGNAGYSQWLQEMGSFTASHVPGTAVAAAIDPGWAHRAAQNFSVLGDGLGLTPGSALGDGLGLTPGFLALPLLTFVALLLRDRSSPRLAQAAVICAVAATAYAIWFLGFSNGWPRYALIGLCLFAAAAAFAAAAMRSERLAIPMAVAMLLLVLPWARMEQLEGPVRYSLRNGFVENERVTALRAAGRYLDEGAGRDSIVVGYSWASLVAVQFVSNTPPRVVGFNRLYTARLDLPGTLLLRDRHWDEMAKESGDPTYLDYLEFVRHCQTEVLSRPPIALLRCDIAAD